MGQLIDRLSGRVARDVAKYGIASAINRGLGFLLLPFLTSLLSIENFGLYNVVHVTVQLMASVITFNGSAGVLREGAESVGDGLKLVWKYVVVGGVSTLVVGVVLIVMGEIVPWWVVYVLFLALAEGTNNLVLAVYRAADRSWGYIILTVAKAIGFVLVVVLAARVEDALAFILATQAGWTGLVAVGGGVAIVVTNWERFRAEGVYRGSFWSVARYTVLLIPHTGAQWILSGSDRIIIKWIKGDAEVGIYSIAYTLAMVLMLLNSGLALAFPQRLIKGYTEWKDGGAVVRLARQYSAASVALLIAVLGIVEIDRWIGGFLGYYEASLPQLIGVVAAGMVGMGYYHMYAAFVFYYRKTGRIASLTLLVAVLNVSLTAWLVFEIGIMGAAIATMASYLVYAGLMARMAVNVEGGLHKKVALLNWYMLGTAAAMILMGSLHGMVWS